MTAQSFPFYLAKLDGQVTAINTADAVAKIPLHAESVRVQDVL
jgi:hypothetical protein